MPGGQAQKNDPGVFVQIATGWHPPFWTWHSSKSINLSKMEHCQENNPPNGATRNTQLSPLMEEQQTVVQQMLVIN